MLVSGAVESISAASNSIHAHASMQAEKEELLALVAQLKAEKDEAVAKLAA